MISDKLPCTDERERLKAQTMAAYVVSFGSYVDRVKQLVSEIYSGALDNVNDIDLYKPINIVFAINRGWMPDYYVSVMLGSVIDI